MKTWICIFASVVGFHCTFFPQCMIPGYYGLYQAAFSWLHCIALHFSGNCECSFRWGSNFQYCWQTHCARFYVCTLNKVFSVATSLTKHLSVLGTLEILSFFTPCRDTMRLTYVLLSACSSNLDRAVWVTHHVDSYFYCFPFRWSFGYENAVVYWA